MELQNTIQKEKKNKYRFSIKNRVKTVRYPKEGNKRTNQFLQENLYTKKNTPRRKKVESELSQKTNKNSCFHILEINSLKEIRGKLG